MKKYLPRLTQIKANMPSRVKAGLLIVALWALSTSFTLLLSLHTYKVLVQTQQLNHLLVNQAQSISTTDNAIVAYAALPSSVSEISPQVLGADARPVTIEAYFQAYKSPLANLGLGDFIVKTSDKHGVDPYLVVAISQQESNLCKIIPDDSHNCWGWGVHSEGTLRFESYEQAAQAVIRGLKEDYFDKGYNTPEEIMKKYTPLSSGTWAFGVNQFLAELNSGNF